MPPVVEVEHYQFAQQGRLLGGRRVLKKLLDRRPHPGVPIGLETVANTVDASHLRERIQRAVFVDFWLNHPLTAYPSLDVVLFPDLTNHLQLSFDGPQCPL